MFGFGKKKSEPRKQEYMLKGGGWGSLPEDKEIRYAAEGNSLVLEGTIWPPIIVDNASYDRSKLFEHIAEGLNVLSRYRAIVSILRDDIAGCKAGKLTAVDIKDRVERIIAVIDQKDRALAKAAGNGK